MTSFRRIEFKLDWHVLFDLGYLGTLVSRMDWCCSLITLVNFRVHHERVRYNIVLVINMDRIVRYLKRPVLREWNIFYTLVNFSSHPSSFF